MYVKMGQKTELLGLCLPLRLTPQGHMESWRSWNPFKVRSCSRGHGNLAVPWRSRDELEVKLYLKRSRAFSKVTPEGHLRFYRPSMTPQGHVDSRRSREHSWISPRSCGLPKVSHCDFPSHPELYMYNVQYKILGKKKKLS